MLDITDLKEWLEEYDFKTNIYNDNYLLVKPQHRDYEHIEIKRKKNNIIISLPLEKSIYQFKTIFNENDNLSIYKYLDTHLIDPISYKFNIL